MWNFRSACDRTVPLSFRIRQYVLRRENIWRKEAGERPSEILPFGAVQTPEHRPTIFIGGTTDNAGKVLSFLLRAPSDPRGNIQDPVT
jgi:hypothetical protein